MLSFGRNCRIVLTSCSQSCRSSTVSDEFISPATNLSPKSWRVKAPAWSRIQVGLMNTRTTIHTHSPWRTHYRALTTSAHDNNHYIDIWHRNKETVCQMSTISWTSNMIFFAGIGSEEVQPFSMSLEAEMMLEQLKEQHLQEMEDLRHQLESKVRYTFHGVRCMFVFFHNNWLLSVASQLYMPVL